MFCPFPHYRNNHHQNSLSTILSFQQHICSIYNNSNNFFNKLIIQFFTILYFIYPLTKCKGYCTQYFKDIKHLLLLFQQQQQYQKQPKSYVLQKSQLHYIFVSNNVLKKQKNNNNSLCQLHNICNRKKKMITKYVPDWLQNPLLIPIQINSKSKNLIAKKKPSSQHIKLQNQYFKYSKYLKVSSQGQLELNVVSIGEDLYC
eukprot:TRINITY_DN1259_c1_g1_i8.p1 TRINITY_DN1259_c1_g1~~TRINITY_DN1259_c1_g1_i8.p1  ORF type:complete len:201 (-),score=-12.03 TRINITY_DN1259_c1_g1_i8:865-1467(-)